MRISYSKSDDIVGVAMDKSLEEGFPWDGSQVGESELRITSLEQVSEFRM